LGYYKPASIQSSFLPPISGHDGKMSSSESSKGILSIDSKKEIKNKINKYAFSGGGATLEEHRLNGGNPDIDVSFLYLKYLFEPSCEKLKELELQYRSGKMLSGELKNYLIKKIQLYLEEHQKRRKLAKIKISEFLLKT
jgi:tryptophanyl-tRNA synthetase